MKKIFCFLGLHWLMNHEYWFTDLISGESVYMADCACGKKRYMTDSLFPLAGFRVEKLKDEERGLELRTTQSLTASSVPDSAQTETKIDNGNVSAS